MIKRIELENFQGHKKSALSFHPGINVIIGQSNQGKSSIMRAFRWVRWNRPVGTGHIVSHWALDAKGNQKVPTSVALSLGEDATISRVRDKDTNAYSVPGLPPFSAVKTEVPQEVADLLNLEDVNLQRQMDAPFLLSASPGDVALFFNKIIRLDIIDEVLTLAERNKRRAKEDVTNGEKRVSLYEEQAKAYTWIGKAEKAIEQLERVEDRVLLGEQAIEALAGQLEALARVSATLSSYTWLDKAQGIVKKLEVQQAKLEANEEEQAAIVSLLSRIAIQEKTKAQYDGIEKAYPIVAKIDGMKAEYKALTKEVKDLEELIDDLQGFAGKVATLTVTITGLEGQLPAFCPLCGKPYKEESCF